MLFVDGDLDLLLGGQQTQDGAGDVVSSLKLFRNDGTTFTEQTTSVVQLPTDAPTGCSVAENGRLARSIAFGDYDNVSCTDSVLFA